MTQKPTLIQEHCSVEHLAALFRQCRDEIVKDWQQHAKVLLSALKLDHTTLTDHVPDIVDEIIWDLTHRSKAEIAKADQRGSHPRHGAQRVSDGLNIGQVVAEYNLLRDAFFTVADQHCLYLVGEALRIINHRIDEGVRAAVTAFAAEQARNLRASEEEHMAFIAHDLRTPVNAIALLVEELKMARDDNAMADTEETFELLTRNLKRLSQQIKQVLERHAIAPAMETVFHPQCRTFELWPLVQGLILDFRPIAEKAGIRVINQIPHMLTIWADAGLVSQALQNLMANAFKHTPNGEVSISASAEAGCVTCCVQDTGTGIPAGMLARVFDKHVTSSDESGAGLGLAIVKQIVEAHGGVVSVESTPGAGTSFCFTLPAPSEN